MYVQIMSALKIIMDPQRGFQGVGKLQFESGPNQIEVRPKRNGKVAKSFPIARRVVDKSTNHGLA